MVRVLSLARQRTAHPARTYTHYQQHTGYTLTRVAHTLLHAKSGRVPTEAGNTHTRRHTPTTRRHPLSGPLPVASGPQQLRPAARHMPHRATHCGARHMVPAEPAQTRRTGQPACDCPAPPHGPARIDAAGVVHEPRRMQGVCPRPRGMRAHAHTWHSVRTQRHQRLSLQSLQGVPAPRPPAHRAPPTCATAARRQAHCAVRSDTQASAAHDAATVGAGSPRLASGRHSHTFRTGSPHGTVLHKPAPNAALCVPFTAKAFLHYGATQTATVSMSGAAETGRMPK